MLSQEEVGELVLESLEKCFYDLISLEKYKYKYRQKLYKKALDNYKKAVENANYYVKHSDDLVW